MLRQLVYRFVFLSATHSLLGSGPDGRICPLTGWEAPTACLPRKSPKPIFTLPFFDMVAGFRSYARRGVNLPTFGGEKERDRERQARDEER